MFRLQFLLIPFELPALHQFEDRRLQKVLTLTKCVCLRNTWHGKHKDTSYSRNELSTDLLYEYPTHVHLVLR